MRTIASPLLSLLLFASLAEANPKTLSISGYLEQSGAPVNGTRNLIVRVGNGTCFPYTKSFTNYNIEDGFFSLDLTDSGDIGDPLSTLFNISSTNSLSGLDLDNNACTISGGPASIANFSAHITVGDVKMGLIPIRASAFAHFAHKAETTSKIQGQPISAVPPVAEQFLKFSGANWAPGSLVATDIPDLSATYVLQTGVPTCSTGQFLRKTAGNTILCEAPSTVNITTGAGLTGGPILGTGTISIATGGITSAHIADGAITSADLATGIIDSSLIANGAVTLNKLNNSGATTGSIIRFNGAGWQVEPTGPGNNKVPSTDGAGNLTIPGRLSSTSIQVSDTDEINSLRLCRTPTPISGVNAVITCPGVKTDSFCSCSKDNDTIVLIASVEPGNPSNGNIRVNFSNSVSSTTVKCICYN
jgi:hypothetical protein